MKIEIIFFIVLTIIIAYIFVLYKVEKMVGDNPSTPSTVDQIKDAVKQIYLADVEAIRNLSAVATKLQADGLTVPGQLKVVGKLATNNLDPANMPDGWGGGLRIFDGYSSGTMGFGPDGKKLNASINKDGAITGTNINIADKIIVNDNITNPNGKMRLSNQGIMFGGPNTDREVNSGQITAGLHIANSLNIVGMSANKGADTRRIDMWAEGGLNVYGNINTNGLVLQKRNKAKLIKVGNLDPTIAKDYWTLIELRAYDHAGNNVAQGKPVSIVQGSAYGGTPPGNITDGRIFNAPNQHHDNWNLGYHGNPGINALQIDLGAEIDLSEIVLFNRLNAENDSRMDGTTIELIGADNNRNRIIHTGLWHRQYSKEYLL